MTITVLGLGRMGTAISGRVLELGHDLRVWNRSPERAAPLVAAGAHAAATPAEAVSHADTILVSLTDAAAQAAVYAGPDGLVAGLAPGKLVIDLSTVRPQVSIDLAAKVHATGAAYVECPVGGTTGPARSGQLLGFAGGTKEDVARARPLLETLCRKLVHAGEVGAGASLKLAVNLPLLVYWQALGEALALCRTELSTAELIEVLSETSGAPPVLKARAPAIVRALGGEDVPATTFDVDSIRKDLRTMKEEADVLGITLPLVERTLPIYDAASAAGWSGQDAAALPAYWPRKGAAQA